MEVPERASQALACVLDYMRQLAHSSQSRQNCLALLQMDWAEEFHQTGQTVYGQHSHHAREQAVAQAQPHEMGQMPQNTGQHPMEQGEWLVKHALAAAETMRPPTLE